MLVDTSVVEVDGSVDEVDVLKIQLDNVAVVEVDALEGRKLGGAISFIGAEANQQNQGGVVSYPVKARLTLPDDVELPAGLSARRVHHHKGSPRRAARAGKRRARRIRRADAQRNGGRRSRRKAR